MAYHWLEETGDIYFPHPRNANADGILAVGGDLSAERLLLAYQNGIFPWYNEEDDEPIIWWYPNPRFVLRPHEAIVSSSMRKILARKTFDIRINTAFEQVIAACAQTPRADQLGTWLNDNVRAAYTNLHRLGYAHSVEAWQDGELVGGFYGIAIHKIFFGESMFSHRSNASKAAFLTFAAQLAQQNFTLIDCQVPTEHLRSLGAYEIPADDFTALIQTNIQNYSTQ
jgi:leucyl/phenylalanyl-tRNA---protein transferase